MQPQHLVVPPFQRPYVWEKEEQWVPLWQDVRQLAELWLAQASADVSHFLGAIVVQAQESVLGGQPASSVIDGQQRLTTLQLLMDAAAATLATAGHDPLAMQLDRLTHNEEMYVPGAPTRLKLRHSNRDKEAFDEVMDADVPVAHETLTHAKARVVRAHEYFTAAVTEWLDAGADGVQARADALTGVLTRGLQLVAINLTASENSQEIFETLNARGTPLTAADLVRNFVFQRLAADGADVRTHLDDWPFETEFWEQEVSVGRYPMQRSSLFFNQWLIAETGQEVSPRATFARFKRHVEQLNAQHGMKVGELLPQIKDQADRYEAWTWSASDADRQLERVELAVYRMKASDTEVLKPLLIWLHQPNRSLPSAVIDRVVSIAESWLIRRQLLRLSLGDMGRVVPDVIRLHDKTPADELAESIEGYLSRLNVTSTYWPGDDEIREALRTEPMYRRFKKARLRMLLEAVEDAYRKGTNQPPVPRRGYPIEHILPQKWTDHWPVEDDDAAAARAEHVHRLGNLTLLTGSLNSKVSNGPWASKRDALQKHDTLLLNSRLLADTASPWNESAIEARADAMTDVLLAAWPIPAGHQGVVVDPHEKSAGWILIKHLVDAGLLEAGTVLIPRGENRQTRTAVVRSDGLLELEGRTFDTPTGAGRHLTGGILNGWTFWSLPDGRKLRDIRALYSGTAPVPEAAHPDWSALHTILEALPRGRSTAVEALADAIGTTAQAVTAHVTECATCADDDRILRGGAMPAAPTADASGTALEASPGETVVAEGEHGPARGLDSDELQTLIEQ